MIIEIYRSPTGWSFSGSGQAVRVRLPAGSEWLPVAGEGLCLFVQTEPMIRSLWSAGRVAREVEAGNLDTVGRKKKYACAKEAR